MIITEKITAAAKIVFKKWFKIVGKVAKHSSKLIKDALLKSDVAV